MEYFMGILIAKRTAFWGTSLCILLCVITACAHKDLENKEQLVFDAELSGFTYPFNLYDFDFISQRQKLTMRYGDLGDKRSNKIALLLHGKNFAGYYWNRIAKDLVKRGYRVIIPDQIGFGKSSKPSAYQFSFAQLSLNTLKLMEHLGIKKFTVVGHSMGGMLSTHLALMTDRVNRLVLINPIGLERYLEFVEYKDPGFFYEKEREKTVEAFRAYQRKNYYDGEWKPEYEALLTPFKGWKNGPDWHLIAWNSALTYGPIFSEEIVSGFSRLSVETHLILGTRDRTGPGRGWKRPGVNRKLGQYQKLGKTIKSKNPQKIRLYELNDLGHMPQFEDYRRFSETFFSIL
jgi:pimeloyl-ACP methyl ester carboxylesterase